MQFIKFEIIKLVDEISLLSFCFYDHGRLSSYLYQDYFKTLDKTTYLQFIKFEGIKLVSGISFSSFCFYNHGKLSSYQFKQH